MRFALTLLLCVTSLAAQTTIHVPLNQPTIQDGITAAVNGDTVLVAPGVYDLFFTSSTLSFQGKAITVTSSGGPTQTTILNLGERAISFANSEGPDSILDGFTIRGSIDELYTGDRFGAGLFISGASPTITNCIIQNCSISPDTFGSGGAGAGVFISGGSPTFLNCVIANNTIAPALGGSPGGGLFISGGGTTTLTSCTISGNHAGRGTQGGAGGGLFCVGSAVLTDCVIENNEAARGSEDGGNGGGIRGNVNVSLTNCIIRNNKAGRGVLLCGGSGGGISGAGTVSGCLIEGNEAGQGGFNGGTGGGIGGGTLIVNTIVRGNTAGDGNPGGLGGGITTVGTLVNCTVYGNTSGLTASSQTLAPGGGAAGALNAVNSVFWRNTPDQLAPSAGNPPTVTFSCVQDGYPGAGNISLDPRLVLPCLGDAHLAAASPCIDAGSGIAPSLPLDDFEGDARVIGGVPDMGADEFSGPTPTALLPGSQEDLVLTTLVNGAGDPLSGQKTAGAGDVITSGFISPQGTFAGELPFLLVAIFASAAGPPTSLECVGELHMGAGAIAVFDGSLHGPLPAGGLSFSGVVPPFFSGFSTRLQTVVPATFAANGFAAFTDAHDIVVP